jgi:hypothetical protein
MQFNPPDQLKLRCPEPVKYWAPRRLLKETTHYGHENTDGGSGGRGRSSTPQQEELGTVSVEAHTN